LAFDERSLAIAVFSFAVFVLAVTFGCYPPALLLWPRHLFITVAAFALAFAMALGCDQMRGRLNFAKNAPIDHAGLLHIVLDGKDRDVELLRSGERGLLVYDRNLDRFIFAKWDSVKGLDWTRRPLFWIAPPQ
jgi:hypothetical protein